MSRGGSSAQAIDNGHVDHVAKKQGSHIQATRQPDLQQVFLKGQARAEHVPV
jgi:hypothetical protein